MYLKMVRIMADNVLNKSWKFVFCTLFFPLFCMSYSVQEKAVWGVGSDLRLGTMHDESGSEWTH